MTKAAPDANEKCSHSRPAVRFPKRLDLVQFEDGSGGFGIAPATNAGDPARVANVRFSSR